MLIEQGDLRIRSATVEDAQLLNAWWRDVAVMQYAENPMGLSEKIEETIAKIELNNVQLSQQCIIEIFSKPVGEVSYKIIDDFVDVDIKLCDFAYHNKGYGSQLLDMIVGYVFGDKAINEKMKIQRIGINANVRDDRAQRVCEKVAFRKMDIRVNVLKDPQGIWQSFIHYELTREGYKKSKS